MIISDLETLEIIRTEDTQIEGAGTAISTAGANAYANGQNFAGTTTSTYTSASAGSYYYYYSGPSAYSGSSSSSAAA